MTTGPSGTAGAIERGRLCASLCVIAMILSAVLCGIVFFSDAVFDWSGFKTFRYGLFPFLFALIFSVSAFIRAKFFTGAMIEEEEKELLERRKASVSSILDVSEDVRFTAARTLANFEKYVPSVLAIVGSILGALLLYLFRQEPEAVTGEMGKVLLQTGIPKNPVNLAFLCIVCAAFAFFSGIFMVGQSHVGEFRWLRPAGNMLIFGGTVMFLSAAAALLFVYGKNAFEPWFAKIVFGCECVLTAELLIDFIIEFYRPRSGEQMRPVYESRLLSFFTEPGGVVRNIAESLDYQFGFNVSKTSVYLFVQRYFVPALMIWAVLLWLFTSFGEVHPGEMGIRERFGAATGCDLMPGVHWKLPWPFERIICVPVDQLQKVVVGTAGTNEVSEKAKSVILWTGEHYMKEDPFLVASKTDGQDISYSVAILQTSLPIYYRAKRDAVRDYAFQFNDIPEALLAIGKAEATAYFASTDFLADISDAREKVCRDLKNRIQEQCDNLKMGIEIVSVDMMDAHPPIGKERTKREQGIDTNVAEAFQLEVIAMEDAKVKRSAAESQKAAIDGSADVESLKILSDAQVYRYRTLELAKSEVGLFRAQSSAWKAQPEIFVLRTYLNFLTNDCRDLRKFVVSSELLSRIYEFNFEEKAKVDLMEDSSFNDIGKQD